MDACCSRVEQPTSPFRFTVNGNIIAPDDTAMKLELQDGDTIDVELQSGSSSRTSSRSSTPPAGDAFLPAQLFVFRPHQPV